jgi:DNA-binding NarL/FixJ family response regulator
MADPEAIRVLVVAPDPLVLSGLASRFAQEPAIAGVQTAGSLREARALLSDVDVVLWDAGLGETELALAAPWPLRPFVLTLVSSSQSLAPALHAGARGALHRERDAADFVPALLSVARGLYVLEPELAKERFAAGEQATRAAEELTPREREVLGLMAQGLSNKAIAQRLSITEHTAKFHVNAVLQKLGADGRTAAVVKAARLGWISL